MPCTCTGYCFSLSFSTLFFSSHYSVLIVYWELMGFHLKYPPERGIELEQTLQLLSKDLPKGVFGAWKKKCGEFPNLKPHICRRVVYFAA